MATHSFRGIDFKFSDTKDIPNLIPEIFSDNYKVLAHNIEFKQGDVILDVGANEGVFSIMMSKIYPQTRIIALEPVPRTFKTLSENIALNHCTNIQVVEIGAGRNGDGGHALFVSKDYSGGSTSLCTYNPDHHIKTEVKILPLDDIFEQFNISQCKLMKMDIEGMEYEALYFSNVLPRTEFMAAEFHMNRRLEFASRRMDGLINWVSNRTKLIHFDRCMMAE